MQGKRHSPLIESTLIEQSLEVIGGCGGFISSLEEDHPIRLPALRQLEEVSETIDIESMAGMPEEERRKKQTLAITTLFGMQFIVEFAKIGPSATDMEAGCTLNLIMLGESLDQAEDKGLEKPFTGTRECQEIGAELIRLAHLTLEYGHPESS